MARICASVEPRRSIASSGQTGAQAPQPLHMAALIVSAPLNGLRSMITGWFAIETEAKDA